MYRQVHYTTPKKEPERTPEYIVTGVIGSLDGLVSKAIYDEKLLTTAKTIIEEYCCLNITPNDNGVSVYPLELETAMMMIQMVASDLGLIKDVSCDNSRDLSNLKEKLNTESSENC